MQEIECKNCGNQFFRFLSRKAKYCSFNCSVLDKRKPLIADLNNESSEMCYWMGFLFGDGSINKSGKLQVCLAAKDAEHLISLSKYLFDENHVNMYNGKCHLQYSSPDIIDPLAKYGIISNKTKDSILNLPERNEKDFIRGYFDADGWFSSLKYRHKNGKIYPKYCLGICSFLPENLEIINSQLPVNGRITKKKKQELYELRFQSKNEIENVRNYLYGTPNLKRKWFAI